MACLQPTHRRCAVAMLEALWACLGTCPMCCIHHEQHRDLRHQPVIPNPPLLLTWALAISDSALACRCSTLSSAYSAACLMSYVYCYMQTLLLLHQPVFQHLLMLCQPVTAPSLRLLLQQSTCCWHPPPGPVYCSPVLSQSPTQRLPAAAAPCPLFLCPCSSTAAPAPRVRGEPQR
jgi:hypothetical protein